MRTKNSTTHKEHKLKRAQKNTNQKQHETRTARTKNSTNQKEHELKRAQKNTNQKEQEP